MEAVKLEVMLLIVVAAVTKLSNEDSHRTTDAEFPDKVNVVELVPEQTDVAPKIVPGTAAELTEIEMTGVFTAAQTPLEETTR